MADGAGLREQSKQQRQERICAVTRQLFAEHGYDATTIREIAAKTAMDKSTLFRYISEKRDLIYLTCSQELTVLNDVSLAAPRSWHTFEEKIVSMIEPRYRLFSSEPKLAKIFLSETLYPTPGRYQPEYLQLRQRFVQGIEALVAQARQTGELPDAADVELVGRHIFFSYAGAVRWWLSAAENPDWRAGMRDYTRALQMLVAGLNLQTDEDDVPHAPVVHKDTGSRRQLPSSLQRTGYVVQGT